MSGDGRREAGGADRGSRIGTRGSWVEDGAARVGGHGAGIADRDVRLAEPALGIAGRVAVIVVLLGLAVACSPQREQAQAPATSAEPVVSGPRVVSLVPAVTEMLFAVGAGPQVVGVSSHDTFPAEVATRPRVGALLDPDLERILALKPALVVSYGSQTPLHDQLARAGIEVMTYRHGGIGDTLAMLEEVGRRTGHEADGRQAAQVLRAQLTGIRMRVEGRRRPRTLLVFGREPGAIRQVWASGGIGFLHELLDVAGAENVFGDVARENVQAGTEQVLARRPEAIVELRAEARPQESPSPWLALPALPAVASGRVLTLEGSQFVVPGPRLGEAAEALARALHPEAFR